MAGLPDRIRLWPTGAPELAGTPGDELPALTPYWSHAAAPAGAVVVCPGGGYSIRAEHEGAPVARWLNRLGIAAFVLDYRVAPHRHPVPLNDAKRAIRTVRANADRWNIRCEAVGILGFSAGGHLAATAATQWDEGNPEHDDLVERTGCRPDLAILCYPVISFMQVTHVGSMTNLLGESPTLQERRAQSAELNVTAQTPPTFLWHTAADEGVDVEHSLLFAAALRRHGVPFALHVFPFGAHGLGLAPDHPDAAIWPELCARFLRGQGFAAASAQSA